MPAQPTRKASLEPVPAIFAGVVVIHLLLAGAGWFLIPILKPSVGGRVERYWFSPEIYGRTAVPQSSSTTEPAADSPPERATKTKSSAVPPAVRPEGRDRAPAKGKPQAEVAGLLDESPGVPAAPYPSANSRQTGKTITLSPLDGLESEHGTSREPTGQPFTMMDLVKMEKLEEENINADGADMDPVLKALEDALKRAWEAPSLKEVPLSQRDARMQVSIGRNGAILETRLERASGSVLMDESAKAACQGVKKISKPLPSKYPKDRYRVEINFHIE